MTAAAGMIEPETWRALGAPVWRFDSTGTEAGPDRQASFLVSATSYDDFVLQVEFYVEDETNSGVFVRCGEVLTVENVNPFDCYEVNIYDNHPMQDARTGAVVRHVVPVARVDTVGHWNTLEIHAQGPQIDVLVNGIATASMDDARTAAGPIALQYGGTGLLRFRNLVIETGSGITRQEPRSHSAGMSMRTK